MSGSRLERHIVDLSGCLSKLLGEPEGAPDATFNDFLRSVGL